MAMEGVGLGLGVLGEVRANVKSLQERFACYKEGPELFETVDSTLTRITSLGNTISSVLDLNPDVLPNQILHSVLETKEAVDKSLKQAESTLKPFREHGFLESTDSGTAQAHANKRKLFFSAKSLHKMMKEVEKEARSVEGILQHQLTQLCLALKTHGIQGNMRNIAAEMHEMKGDMQRLVGDTHCVENPTGPAPVEPITMTGTKETYRPASNVPPLPENLYLEFNSLDEEGKFCAPDGELRSTVLSSTTSNHVIVAHGAATSPVVHGATGMAGVGKTMALIALGHDEAIRTHLRDGVLFMSLGADASVEHVTRGLATMMKFTGAIASATAVRNQGNLSEASN